MRLRQFNIFTCVAHVHPLGHMSCLTATYYSPISVSVLFSRHPLHPCASPPSLYTEAFALASNPEGPVLLLASLTHLQVLAKVTRVLHPGQSPSQMLLLLHFFPGPLLPQRVVFTPTPLSPEALDPVPPPCLYITLALCSVPVPHRSHLAGCNCSLHPMSRLGLFNCLSPDLSYT